MISEIKQRYKIDLCQSLISIKKPVRGTIKNWPSEPAAITTPRDNVWYLPVTALPTAPNITAVPHPAHPNPKITCETIRSNEPSTSDIK